MIKICEENKQLRVKFLKDVTFTDQNGDKQKIKKGKILSANVNKNEDGKDEYEITYKKNVFLMYAAMKDVAFEVL